MKKLFTALLLTSSLSSFAAGGVLIDVLLDNASKLIVKSGDIPAQNAQKAQDDIFKAILGISGSEKPSPEQLMDSVKQLQAMTPDDVKLQEELLTLLSKENPTADDVILAKDKMMLLAINLGKVDRSTVLACNGSCTTAGLRFQKIQSANLAEIADQVPVDEKTLTSTVRSSLRTKKFGRLPRKSYFREGHLRNLAIYLKLVDGKESANLGQKRMIEGITDFSTVNGKTSLVDEDNQHFFFSEVVTGDYKESELLAFAKVLKEAAKRSDSLQGRQKAFFDVLEEMSDGHPSMKKALKELKDKNCFFNKK